MPISDVENAVRKEKERIRAAILARRARQGVATGADRSGKTAERLRRIAPYRAAKIVMAFPSASLRQICVNVLIDRKNLVMPTPGLQNGFLLVKPECVPAPKRVLAVKGLQGNPWGCKMPYDRRIDGGIDFIVAESIAGGGDGSRLGDGSGRLDLQYAVLSFLGLLHASVRIAAIVEEDGIVDSIPMKPSDVGAHWLVTPDSAVETTLCDLPAGEILWEELSKKTIRRNDALFYIYRKLHPGPI